MALGSFRFQAKVTLARRAPACAGDDLAVNGQLEHAVVGLDTVMIPLASRLGTVLARQTALPPLGVRAVGLQMRAVDAEEIAVAGVVGRVSTIENLDLDPPRKRDA